MKKVLLVLLLLGSIFVMSKQDSYKTMLKGLYSHSVPVIYSNELDKMTRNSGNMVLIDTRSADEFKVSHIEGATFMDYESFEESETRRFNKSDTLVFYCSVGYRSEKIAEIFQNEGFENIFNLYGGIFDWVNKENKIVNNKNIETDNVHAYNRKWGVWLKRGVKVYE